MSIFDNLLDRFGIVTKARFNRELNNLQRWQLDTADAQQWIMPDPYIYATQADFYRMDASLGTALDILAEDVGNSKLNVNRVRDEKEVDIPNHPFEILMEHPNPLQTGLELLAEVVTDYKLNGNAVWWLNRQSAYDKPLEIWYIPFHQIKPIPDGRMYLAGYEYSPGNGKEPIMLPTWQIVHFKTRNPFNRYVGLSPVESIVNTLVGNISMKQVTRHTYAQRNGEPPSIIAFKDHIPDEAWADILRKIKESAEQNKMMALRGAGESVSWMSRVLSSKDMDFIAQLKQNSNEIMDRMTPGLRAMLEADANRSTADAARATYSEKSLWRMLEVIAKKVTHDILPAYGLNLRAEFDDPRIVDVQLELARQDAFERTHTVKEVREEFYQDDPLGDERDDLLVVQIRSAASAPQGAVSPMTEQEEQPTPDNPEEEQPDPASKSAIDDLLRWRRMAVGGKAAKAAAFKSNYIPAGMVTDIKRRLPLLADKSQIEILFDRKIDSLKPKPKADPMTILKGLELTVKALEAKKG